MSKIIRLLTTLVSIVIGIVTAATAEPARPADDHAQAGASDNGGHTGNAECPIKKTIDGKLYCFQNDPALTKRQGGGN